VNRNALKPSRRLLALLAALSVAAVGLGVAHALAPSVAAMLSRLWWGALLALAGFALADALRLRRLPSPRIERALPGHLALGRWQEVRLRLHPASGTAIRLQVFDQVPAGMAFEHLPQRLEWPAGTAASLVYRLRPLQRGRFRFPACEVVLPSPLGLWLSRRRVEVADETRVYPDFAHLHGARLSAVDDWLGRLGIRQRPRRGLGLEFHQLRDFREGDSLRQIDWKATARKGAPIAREYQDERDQQIILLLDCGRRMRSQDGELSHFDHALNACLLLGYTALRQGDAVGLSTFASDQPRHLAPRKGQPQLSALLNAVFDLQSTQRPADYAAAAQTLLARQQRRALVVVLTNLRDEDDQALLDALQRLGRRHRVLLASLREEALDRLRQIPVRSHDDTLAYCGAVDYLASRSRLHERLAAQGVPLLDVRPGELGPQLVSQYLAWKKAGAL
jgi:uncharacterized protein (DUF58 family)